ncbi:MAG TPA: undecaprenyl-phosphate glucose phosphotransferase [Pirellulales bacterium]|jgi:Undecaprenyl-phosphate glucose phosphotransferase|nr:undecaprenyl-phosphate glucose phosphotransferase [Pirellulales bacterium]
MYRRHGQKLGLVFLACDLLVTAGIWFVAYFVRYALLPAPYGVPNSVSVATGLPMALLMAAAAYRLCGLYEVHRLRELPRELSVVCHASGLLFLLDITATFYRRDPYDSRLGMAVFLALNALALTAARRLLWQALKLLRKRGLNYGRAVIVGAGRTGRMVSETIRANSWTGLEAVGFVDQPARHEPLVLPRLGTIDQLGEIVVRHQADHVFIALPLARYGQLPEVYQALEGLLVEVQLVPDLPNLAGMRVRNLEIDGVSFLSLRGNPHYGWGSIAKRSTDLVLGAAALVLAAPLMLALAALIKLTSPGPVLYRQKRTGLGERTFNMLKFRSMRADAEQATGPIWAHRGDQRCTPLGRCMRRWSLDELPQLFNVLAGDMSLVGPRPERGFFIEKLRRQIPTYAQRHQVKAGITGWAQVNGWRGNTSPRRRLECDLYYISHWSLWLDFKILLLTLWRGFRHTNAY